MRTTLEGGKVQGMDRSLVETAHVLMKPAKVEKTRSDKFCQEDLRRGTGSKPHVRE